MQHRLSGLWKPVGLFILIYLIFYWIFQQPAVEQGLGHLLLGLSLPVAEAVAPQARFATNIEQEEGINSLRIGYADERIIEQQMEAARRSGAGQVDVDMSNAEYNLSYYSMPFIFLITLVLITPLTVRHRLRAVLAGSLLMLLFLWIKMQIALTAHLMENGLISSGSTWRSFMTGLRGVMQLGFSFAMAALIWFLVAFQKSNWQHLLNRFLSAPIESKKEE